MSDPINALQQLAQIWVPRGEQDFGALLGLVTLRAQAFPLDPGFRNQLAPPWVAVVLEAETLGDVIVVMRKRDAAVLVDVTIGGDGRVPSLDFSELHLQVVEEFFSTMVGPLLDPLRESSGQPLMLHVKDRRMDNVAPAIPGDGGAIEFTIHNELMPESTFYVLFTAAAAAGSAALLDGGIPSAGGDIPMSVAAAPPPAAAAPPPMAPPVMPTAPPPMPVAAPPMAAPAYAGYPPQAPQGYAPQPGWPPQQQAQAYAVTDPAAYAPATPPWGQPPQPMPARPAGPSQDEITYQNLRLGTVTPQPPAQGARVESIRFLMDLPLKVTAVLGRSDIQIKDLLEMGVGSVLELDRYENEPVDLLVNDKLVARGEVVVVEDRFGIRITETISETERLKGIGG